MSELKPIDQELSNLVTDFVCRRERTSFFRVDLDDIVSEAIQFERERMAKIVADLDRIIVSSHSYMPNPNAMMSFQAFQIFNEALAKLREVRK